MPFDDQVEGLVEADAGVEDPDLRPDGALQLTLPDADPAAPPPDAVFVMPDAFVSDAAIVRETTTLVMIRDTFVRAANPTFNYGAEPRACSDRPNDARVALLQPELSPIPPGAIVEAAELHLWTGTLTNDYSIEQYTVHEVQEAWNEGSQLGATGTSSWNLRQGGTPWTAVGIGVGTRAAVAVGSFTPLLIDTEFTIPVDPALVNRWLLDPTTDHGVAIIASGIDGACFVTTEGAAGKRPTLVVTWRQPTL